MKRILLPTIVAATLVFSGHKVLAREGIVQMTANDGTPGICEIYSMLLDNFTYKMLVNCRGLKYPISQDLFQYALWADHGEENPPTFLGTLGVGKRETAAGAPFNRLFVTKEATREPAAPSDNLFMSGTIRSSAFVEENGIDIVEATPIPTEASRPNTQATQEPSIGNFGDAAAEDQDTASPGIGGAIRILGAVVVFVVVIVIIIAFINASRRRPVSL